ncbi:MAG: hypothetical protein HZA82_07285 [Thaumarchaeota archaeon]|nr:hypothetical protein [Nitrososphaerota archaeon]
MTARFAHDIKNPLSIIKANVELLQKYQKESRPKSWNQE